MGEIGDNSGAVNVGRLRSLVERIEKLEDEMSLLREDRKEVYAEAKAEGYDTKTIRKVVSARKKDREKLAEENALFDMYATALEVFG
jgi:uncharacterized protein (UPF0335 family)